MGDTKAAAGSEEVDGEENSRLEVEPENVEITSSKEHVDGEQETCASVVAALKAEFATRQAEGSKTAKEIEKELLQVQSVLSDTTKSLGTSIAALERELEETHSAKRKLEAKLSEAEIRCDGFQEDLRSAESQARNHSFNQVSILHTSLCPLACSATPCYAP